MNANELADELESCRDYELPEFVHKTATMLRQQQAEIAELKDMLGHYEDVYEGVVTHPAELTDEEIYKVWFNYGCGMPWTANTKTFARAILRKAQENG